MRQRTAYYVTLFRACDRRGMKLMFDFPPTVEQISEAVRKSAERLGLDDDVVKEALRDVAVGDVSMQPVPMFDLAEGART